MERLRTPPHRNGLKTPPTRLMTALLVAAIAGSGAVASAQSAPKSSAGSGGGGKSVTVPNFNLSGRAIAVEGDLISINGTPVRIMGIDAPDPGQMCKTKYGREYDCFAIATGVMRSLISEDNVECVVADKDRNGQNEGECRVRGVDLGSAMVSRGWAFAFRSLTETYAKSEAYAQSHRFGMWAGQIERPSQWRSRRLREQAK